ncbi:MAG: hypothetical protein KJ811_03525, partial [Candidatus Margulisbacteria bacterium]|nr:hypothetical protein [Candidatus Margulisiibacteriota bacterium]
GDEQTTFTKADFNAGNLIKTLVSDSWQDKGARNISWNGTNTAGDWVVPGKYAFIVEGRDRAGNLTLKKWGGTVFVQNNILTLKEPDQFDFRKANIIPTPEVNPDPHYISPNGNSLAPQQKRARFYFMIDLSLTEVPESFQRPEKIEASAVIADTKAVGKYSVRVYSDAGLTSLVRTITSGATAQSTTLTWEDWDGKNEAGAFVPDGTYYLVIDVEDFSGDKAEDNLLTKTVVVDNTPPVVSDLEAAPYYFSPATDSPISSTNLSYQVSDNYNDSEVSIDVYQAGTLVRNLHAAAWQNNGTYSLNWNGEGATPVGLHTFKVNAIDQAGNQAVIGSTDVVIDKEGVTFTPDVAERAWSASDIQVRITITDDYSGLSSAQYRWSQDTTTPASGWTDFASGQVLSQANLGVWYLHLKGTDVAGNFRQVYFGPYYKDSTPPSVAVSPISRDWSTAAISVTLNVNDLHSGVNLSRYAWSTSTTPPADSGAWNVFRDGDVVGHSTDGQWYLHLWAEDNVGNVTRRYFGLYKKDTTGPSVTFSGQASDTWYSADNAITIGLSDNFSYRGYKWSWDSWPSVDPSGCNTSTSGSTTHGSQGPRTLYVRAWDWAGNRTDISRVYYRDSVAPVILGLPGGTFNPYVDGNIRANFAVVDPSPTSGISLANISGRVKYGTNIVKTDLTIYNDGSGNYHTFWDGKNNSNDYENEGDYTLEISATDLVGNPAITRTATIYLRDDQRITNNPADSNSPYLDINGNTLNLRWIEGWDDTSRKTQSANVTEQDQGNDGDFHDHEYFSIDHTQDLEISAAAWGETSEYHDINLRGPESDASTIVWSVGGTGDSDGSSHYWVRNVVPGEYYVYIGLGNSVWDNTFGHTQVWYYDRKFNQYGCTSSNLGQSWGSVPDEPEKVDSYNSGPTRVPELTFFSPAGTLVHEVLTEGANVYYRRGNFSGWDYSILFAPVAIISWSPSVKITNSGQAANPSIVEDGSHNAYVVWEDGRHGRTEIYFQKIPHNFAPVTGTRMGAMAVQPVVAVQPIVTVATPLATPTLASPKNGDTVTTLRPAFQWKHYKGSAIEYKLDLAKTEAGLDTLPLSFTDTKSANTGSQADPLNDPTLYNYTYTIHEFDPGLDRDTYYWRVTALSTNEAATSEAWSFTVTPDLTLTKVTNYPNPFNPNHEPTNIRYRLGSDAESVKIRIYDITGALVKEITNCDTEGEGSSVWDKYHDVEWDGKNGRGDIVVNGIYPFEVIATGGGKSVSKRGKIAVLK